MSEAFVVDAFPAFNEFRLAKFRITYMSEFVKHVVIAEARFTQSGLEKPLLFREWLKKQSDDLRSKVTVIEVPLSQNWTAWEREIFTREYLFNYIKEKYANSKFILSDLDEIPSRIQLRFMIDNDGLFRFLTPTYFRKVNWQLQDDHANWSRGIFGDTSANAFPNGGRFTKSIPVISQYPGGHFSWLGIDQNSVGQKSQAAAHRELNETFWTSAELINFCDFYRIDHLGRSRSKGFGLFKILTSSSDDILSAISLEFPELLDDGTDCPPYIYRVLASIKLTSYVSNDNLAKFVRRRIDVSHFLDSNSPLILLNISRELVLTLLYQLRNYFRLKLT